MKISLQFRGAFQMLHGWDMFGWEFVEIVCSKVDQDQFFLVQDQLKGDLSLEPFWWSSKSARGW